MKGCCVASTYLLFLLSIGFGLYKIQFYPGFLELEEETVTGLTGEAKDWGIVEDFSLEMGTQQDFGISWGWLGIILLVAVVIDCLRIFRSSHAYYYVKLVLLIYFFRYVFYLLRDIETYTGVYIYAAERYYVYFLILRALFTEVRFWNSVKKMLIWHFVLGVVGGGGSQLLTYIGVNTFNWPAIFSLVVWWVLVPGLLLFLKYVPCAFLFGWISALISYAIDNYRYATQSKATSEERMTVYAFESLVVLGSVFGLLALGRAAMWILYFIFGEVPWAATMWFDIEVAYACSYFHYGDYPNSDNPGTNFLSNLLAMLFSIEVLKLTFSSLLPI